MPFSAHLAQDLAADRIINDSRPRVISRLPVNWPFPSEWPSCGHHVVCFLQLAGLISGSLRLLRRPTIMTLLPRRAFWFQRGVMVDLIGSA